MAIKNLGGIFGRNPTFNDVTVDGDLAVNGALTVGGSAITGLNYQGGWNASTNTPDIAAGSLATGDFWIVSADGSTNVGGITNWTQGDWALYDGSNWQRVEGGNTDLSTGVQGQLAVANGGTGAADAATARTNLGLAIGTDVEAADATILKSAAIGVTVQGYDADIAKYDDTTANFTGTLQNGGSNVVVDSDIGSTVQAYDANILTSSDIGSTIQGYDVDTTKNDVSNTFTQNQIFNANIGIGTSSPLSSVDIRTAEGGSPTNATFNNALRLTSTATAGVGVGPSILFRGETGNATTPYSFAGIHGVKSSAAGGNYSGDLIFSIQNSGGGTVLAEAARFTSSGNLAFPSGQGIDFSATSGTGTSELLDDYEEGRWTATLTPASGSITLYSGFWDGGHYTKVGRLVTCTGFIRASSVSSPSGALTLGGLPFTAASGTDVRAAISIHPETGFSLGATASFVGKVQEGTSTAILSKFTTTLADLSGDIAVNTGFNVCITYSAA